jgi:hypothetical protein
MQPSTLVITIPAQVDFWNIWVHIAKMRPKRPSAPRLPSQ